MFGLGDDFDRVPSELRYGHRRQVAIARAIAAEPSILLLDEPAAGLHESETEELGLLLRRLADEWGIGILLVEHDVPLLDVHPGEIVVVLGPNGAGKTTTLLTLSGALPSLGGDVLWRGEPTKAALHRRVLGGLGVVPEERSITARLSVRDNLRIGPGPVERALELFPEVRPLLRRRAGVLLVEQHARKALAVADRAYILQRGRVVWSGSADEARKSLRRIERAYLGQDVTSAQP
jgi:ABC-type branched-subunit amino acid transport system ATPase component